MSFDIVRADPDNARRSGPVAVASSRRSAHSARADGLAVVLAGAAADTARTAVGQSQGPRCVAVRGGGVNRLPRIETQVLVTLPTDSRRERDVAAVWDDERVSPAIESDDKVRYLRVSAGNGR